MDVTEIIKDSLSYPLSNIKALIIYMILSIIAMIILVFTGVDLGIGILYGNLPIEGIGVIGIIVCAIVFLLIEGYGLDIIKLGIYREDTSPEIDFVRQILNGIKLIIVEIVYYLIPAIIVFICGLIFRGWLTTIIGIIVGIIFALAAYMGQCRLADTDSLGHALNVGDAIADISRIGLIKLLATIILVGIIIFILAFIGLYIAELNTIIGGIILAIIEVYSVFFVKRATGLLYSNT